MNSYTITLCLHLDSIASWLYFSSMLFKEGYIQAAANLNICVQSDLKSWMAKLAKQNIDKRYLKDKRVKGWIFQEHDLVNLEQMYNIYFGSFLTNDWNHAFPSPCLGPSLLSSSELEVTCLEQLAAPAFPKLMESSNSMLCYKNQNCVFIYNSVPRIRIQWAKISTKYYKKKLKPKSELFKKS